MRHPCFSRKNTGFTLIELSMVLIVIGLIIGGILIGRDLIHAAQVRAAVKQVEEFNAAVNTFLGKYNCLPGDCARASMFGFDAATNGDGSGQVGCSGNNMTSCLNAASFLNSQQTREYVNFWYHLSAASLTGFKGAPFDAADTNQYAGTVSPPTVLPTGMPDIGSGKSGWAIRSDMNFFLADSPSILSRPAHHFLVAFTAVSNRLDDYAAYLPVDTYALDVKMDDGLPSSGVVIAWLVLGTNMGGYNFTLIWGGPGGADSAVCVNTDTTPSSYNSQYYGTDIMGYCSPAIKASF